MSARRKHKEEHSEGGERWLITYADRLITPFSYHVMSGTVLPSIVFVVSMSVGRGPRGSNDLQAPPVVR